MGGEYISVKEKSHAICMPYECTKQAYECLLNKVTHSYLLLHHVVICVLETHAQE